ncbi:putative dolichol kinase [Seiridium cardinale]|uniref:dolichol kinase n=1 Tax=Seiridium cardinale TaxID=138064 RepID=A0ABR2XJ68_9PEZI
MPEHLSSSTAQRPAATSQLHRENDALRLLSRSPHPYHHQKSELLEPLDKFSSSSTARSVLRSSVDDIQPRSRASFPAVSRDTTPTSDSGTEADDEHFLKGLPAPRTKLHKGLRGRNEVLSGTSSPLPSPAPPEDGSRRTSYITFTSKKDGKAAKEQQLRTDSSKRIRVVIRRLAEFILLGSLGALVQTNDDVRPVLHKWRIELISSFGIAGALAALYPLRLVCWGYRHRSPLNRIPLYIPTSFDPAPLLYPPAITLLVSSLISADNDAVLLPNIVLSLCALPPAIFPRLFGDELCSSLHWLVSCAPLIVSKSVQHGSMLPGREPDGASVQLESLVLLYPLHQYLCITLHSLTTTSLLIAELQLLSVALINVMLLSWSPQITIIKAMLWVGGLDILVLCTRVILWGIALARVPKWRFRRADGPLKRYSSVLSTLMSWRRVRHDLFHAPMDCSSCSSCEAIDDYEDTDGVGGLSSNGLIRVQTTTPDGANPAGLEHSLSGSERNQPEVRFDMTEAKQLGHQRRHTLPNIDRPLKRSHTHTPSGRRKRSASSSVRAFFSLTQQQATTRKWLYALYVYLCVIGTIFIPNRFVGVKEFVQEHALKGYEPVGWALGYLFGDLPWFRWQVVSHNLERWICLPPRAVLDDAQGLGWVQYLRTAVFGEANTRLLLSAYYITVLATGLIIVFQLSPLYEVDTRRKVFHFMMVAMFAPSIYVDPTFVALALSIVLALFLLLDLLRASQLPPLSKPLAFFLAPYVDGRDLRGPVVISHIFLLIGCAIPLWLSLGSLPRTGSGYMEGWEVPTREVSMVAGVICVGLGDAAASLIGRRYGHRKWVWGGGKSLEGSLAFATAVLLGLMAAEIWLRVGGWPSATPLDSLPVTVGKAAVCASTASLTEAVLTGGNDNVIVPVVLWTCVKGLGI